MDSTNKLKNKIDKFFKKVTVKEFAFILVFSLMFVFNYFVFGQFEVMANNEAEFSVSPSEVWPIFVLFAALMWVLISAILAFLCYRFKNAYSFTIATMIGMVISSYAQVLFLNKVDNMAVAGTMMRGSVFDFILNFLINAALVFLPIGILILAKKKKIEITSKLALVMAVAVLGMQSVGMFSTFLTVQRPAKDNQLYYFSVEEQLKLSQNDNIIVFILDRLDVSVTDEIFTATPQYIDMFDGFTYYTNNVSEYPGTFPSITSMLTRKEFDKKIKKQTGYFADAWKEEILFSALKDNNYVSNALLDSNATYYDYKELEGKFNNMRRMQPQNRSIKKGHFYNAILNLALMRQAPDVLKWCFTSKYYNIADFCVDIKNTPDYFPRTVSPSGDIEFYNRLTETKLTAEREENVFSFIHLHASHSPYEYDENLNPIQSTFKFNRLKEYEKSAVQTRGTFKILGEYFQQMKQLGIYESSTIIVVGDHGEWGNRDKKLNNIPLTALLVKNKGEAGSTIVTDSHSQLSHVNFQATILELAGAEDKKGEQKSYYDIIANGGIQSPRIFYNVRWTNINSCVYLCAYEITGDASKKENWKTIK